MLAVAAAASTDLGYCAPYEISGTWQRCGGEGKEGGGGGLV